MGNLLSSFKRLLSNKNTITILMVLLGIVVLYIGYNYRINAAISPVSIPYAKEEITSRTEITPEMIGYMEVPQSMLDSNPNIIINANQIIGKVVSFADTIPAQSMFYASSLMDAEDLPDGAYADIPDGTGVFSLPVDMESTLGNSIMPGNRIDLYVRAEDDNGLIIYSKLISSIEVQAVKDDNGLHVFETASENREPAYLIFYLEEYFYRLLNVALDVDLEIVPVPRNASYSANPGDTEVSSDALIQFIEDEASGLTELDQLDKN